MAANHTVSEWTKKSYAFWEVATYAIGLWGVGLVTGLPW